MCFRDFQQARKEIEETLAQVFIRDQKAWMVNKDRKESLEMKVL